MEPDVFDGIVAMCSTMHKTVSVKSTQYLDEMRRHNYVTPTSYLELINMIKMVLEMRQKVWAIVGTHLLGPTPNPNPTPTPTPNPNPSPITLTVITPLTRP